MSEQDPIAEAHRQWVAHGWSEAADGMALVTSVMRVQQLLMERIDGVLRPLDLSFARYEILMLLSFSGAGAMPMTRIGSLLQVHPASVTSAVSRLETQGLLTRSRLQTDRRVVLAALTGRGRRLAEQATAQLNEQVFGRPGLDASATVELTRLLGRLRADAGDPVAGGAQPAEPLG